MSSPTGISPLHGSHAAAPIACDASNARTVAVREYHYLTGQVMAEKIDVFPLMDTDRVSLSCRARSWRVSPQARCLSKVSDCFMKFSKSMEK
ncbi:hypothetical protein [Blautia obeum]|uniref:hypothetical protein n=1 Tax=Blautia obeum TaxID=40520 RepID=UPI0015D2FD1E|nr:hypothetical protein [Blautia obeum]